MGSSRTITLFTERLEVSQSPSSFLLSILAHGVVIGLVSLGILYAPGKNPRILTEHYPVRRLELNASEAQMRGSAGSGIAYPGPYAAAHAPAPGGKPAPGRVPGRVRARVVTSDAALLEYLAVHGLGRFAGRLVRTGALTSSRRRSRGSARSSSLAGSASSRSPAPPTSSSSTPRRPATR